MKNIVYCCQFTDASGYASAARKYLSMLDKFLDKQKYNLKIYNSSYENKVSCSQQQLELLKKYELKNEEVEQFIKNNEYDVIFHLLPHDYLIDIKDRYLNNKIFNGAKRKINIFYWEADKLPELWRQVYAENAYDKVIAACDWNKQVFSKDINAPIEIIPIPFKDKKVNKIKTPTFNILSLSQWQPRKGFDILIKAFYQEFFNNDDAKLIIKTYRGEAFGASDKEVIVNEAILHKNSSVHYLEDPKCKLDIVTGILSEEKLEELYSKSSVFCLTSRGEGFSIPSAEAALYGIPCVVSKFGGHTDFLDRENNFFFHSYLKPIDNMTKDKLFSSCEMNFLEPDILSVRKQLRIAYEMWKKDPQILEQMGQNSKKFACNFLDEKKIFEKFVKFLES